MPAVVSRSGRRGRRAMAEMNMVPFIDVMLVLLIIFMVSAPLITTGIVDLPSVGRAAQRPASVVEVIVGKDETLELKIQDKASRTTLKDVAAAVKRAQAGANNPAVVISADRSVKYEVVVKVMDTLQRAGVQRVGLSVQLAP
jgi:biopolymer transport protein TolR